MALRTAKGDESSPPQPSMGGAPTFNGAKERLGMSSVDPKTRDAEY
jgi:hypothetical protein